MAYRGRVGSTLGGALFSTEGSGAMRVALRSTYPAFPRQTPEDGPMPGSPLAQEPPADDSPSQAWIRDWVDFLTEMLPLILPVVVILIGIVLIFKAKSGIGQVIIFGIGAALVFLLLTNLQAVADFFGNELPIDAPSSSEE
jgi:hypothetical protein